MLHGTLEDRKFKKRNQDHRQRDPDIWDWEPPPKPFQILFATSPLLSTVTRLLPVMFTDLAPQNHVWSLWRILGAVGLVKGPRVRNLLVTEKGFLSEGRLRDSVTVTTVW